MATEGYPVVGEGHPLWDEQQAGWPKLSPHEAMKRAIEHQKSHRGDSASHPAYDPGYIVNAHAVRPKDEPLAGGNQGDQAGKDRR